MHLYKKSLYSDGSVRHSVSFLGCLGSIAALFLWVTTIWLVFATFQWLFGGVFDEGDTRALIVWLGSGAVLAITAMGDYYLNGGGEGE